MITDVTVPLRTPSPWTVPHSIIEVLLCESALLAIKQAQQGRVVVGVCSVLLLIGSY